MCEYGRLYKLGFWKLHILRHTSDRQKETKRRDSPFFPSLVTFFLSSSSLSLFWPWSLFPPQIGGYITYFQHSRTDTRSCYTSSVPSSTSHHQHHHCLSLHTHTCQLWNISPPELFDWTLNRFANASRTFSCPDSPPPLSLSPPALSRFLPFHLSDKHPVALIRVFSPCHPHNGSVLHHWLGMRTPSPHAHTHTCTISFFHSSLPIMQQLKKNGTPAPRLWQKGRRVGRRGLTPRSAVSLLGLRVGGWCFQGLFGYGQ